MSRIGKRPIKIIEGVTVDITGRMVTFKSEKGELSRELSPGLEIKKEDNVIKIGRQNDTKDLRAMHGLNARLIQNMISDLKDGFVKKLEFKGTGYRVRVEDNSVLLNMGYSHEISLPIPAGIEVTVLKNNITVAGIKRDDVGRFAAKIREVRAPEPYKGKGIKYKDEVIKRKAGKAASTGGKV